ncbi:MULTISPECIES: hypothetical protein [Cryobacterium]|uniref:Uncharacterized protein n=1 Tax=Cryobacterium zongtaii TaxID=1259217 RepID=A0A2S3ZGZ1_9MICO|nr:MULTISPECIES: hypothetical protein [Cryobacterium]POH63588.1 hypothetical protein C3B60_15825 [Cryobacterium zongtaii]POH66657.1 hypothetical protein C3B61_08905 [Cryobacterium zongtaii]TFC42073.1 hypothetical protein E3O57_15645 [Cryobacterium sp. TMN-39-2]
MTDASPANAPAPDPAQAVELVLAVTRGAWPATDAAVGDLFATLGVRTVDSDAGTDDSAGDDPSAGETWPSPVDIRRLEVSFGGEVYASWTSHAGDFLGIDLQLYNAPSPNDPGTRLGYDRILALLSQNLGTPTEPWDDEEIPPRQWEVGRWRILLHLFTLRDSGVMLSVDDASTADRAEREASARQDAAHAQAATHRP